MGTLFTFEFTDALPTVFNRLRSHYAASLVLQFTTHVAHNALSGFEHEFECLHGIGWPGQAHEETDSRSIQSRHILRPEGSRLHRVGNAELHRCGGVSTFMAVVDVHVTMFKAAGLKQLFQGRAG